MAVSPQIVLPDYGAHNAHWKESLDRLKKTGTYQDQSTVIVCPTRGKIHHRVISSWFGLIRPMNQKILGPLFAAGMEVGAAYEAMVSTILASPDLSNWKYILTIEEDNVPAPDGLLRLYESIEGQVDGVKYDAVGGLYWTKGIEGQPMCYGDPREMPRNFRPIPPRFDGITPCNGLGMGFTLFRLSLFKDKRFSRPFFLTKQQYIEGKGVSLFTQDLYFFDAACGLGYKFACDGRVKVGHFDEGDPSQGREEKVW